MANTVKVVFIFKSMYMKKDKLELSGDNFQQALAKYHRWWESYGKDKQHANNMLVDYQVMQGIDS